MHLIEVRKQPPMPHSPKEIRAQFEEISTSFYRRFKDVRIMPVIIAKLELGNIERKVLSADLVEGADAAALDERREALNRVGVNGANSVFALAMIDGRVLRIFLVQALVARPLVGAEKADLVRDSLAIRHRRKML